VPDNLILHLKRFEFDYSDFSRKKIYDHFAFPETIDITPYTAEHLSDPSKSCEADLFDLVGVLVHTGNCENGHYYSYIRERPSPTGSSTPTWIDFNDSDVSHFNPAEIAGRTFGGFSDIDEFTRQTKHYSAYMLFYQRRTAVEEDQSRWVSTFPGRAPKIAVPVLFEDEINANNAEFIREYSLYDSAHTRFVRQLLGTLRTIYHGTCSENHDQETRALHIALAHLSHVAWRRYDADTFLELLAPLHRSALSCSSCCSVVLRWLATDKRAVTDLVLRCTHSRIRSQMRTLLVEGLKYLREQDPMVYGFDGGDSDMEVDPFVFDNGVLAGLVRRFRLTLEQSFEGPRGWEDYYYMLSQVAEMGRMETAVILDHGFLVFDLRLLASHVEEVNRVEAPEAARILNKKRGIYNSLIAFLWILLSQTDIRLPVISEGQSRDRQATFDRERSRFPLTKFERSMMFHWSNDISALVILDRIVELFDANKGAQFYPGEIVKWMLESPAAPSRDHLTSTIASGIGLEQSLSDKYLKAALAFCEACPKIKNIVKVIQAASNAVASSSETRPRGQAVLETFNALLKIDNEEFFAENDGNPYSFYEVLMANSREFGIPLLCNYDAPVRHDAYTFLHDLYSADLTSAEDSPIQSASPSVITYPETLHVKYSSARGLLSDLIHRFAYEHDAARNRSVLVPLVDTCRALAQQLFILSQQTDPQMHRFQHDQDEALILQFQQEVENHMHDPMDEGTPASMDEEAYDVSDYGSESDDGGELLDGDC
jgi:ubiquitin carboxyl-terminal hydrolase 34